MLNQRIFEFLFRATHKNFLFDAVIVFLGQYLSYILVVGFLIILFFEVDWRKKTAWFCEAALGIILARGSIVEVIRFFYPVQRPFQIYGVIPLIRDTANSFPSGHAAFFFALAVTILYYHKRWGIFYLFTALVIGIARVTGGTHWPFDIVGGAAVGILSGILVRALFSPYTKKLDFPENINKETA